jgi:hypothetical protein
MSTNHLHLWTHNSARYSHVWTHTSSKHSHIWIHVSTRHSYVWTITSTKHSHIWIQVSAIHSHVWTNMYTRFSHCFSCTFSVNVELMRVNYLKSLFRGQINHLPLTVHLRQVPRLRGTNTYNVKNITQIIKRNQSDITSYWLQSCSVPSVLGIPKRPVVGSIVVSIPAFLVCYWCSIRPGSFFL